jgi:hypothetical protein
MAQNKVEVTIGDKSFGSGNTLKLWPTFGADRRILIRVEHTEPRKDDASADDVTWQGIEADLDELKNAIILMEDAQFESVDDHDKCVGCGKP